MTKDEALDQAIANAVRDGRNWFAYPRIDSVDWSDREWAVSDQPPHRPRFIHANAGGYLFMHGTSRTAG